MLKACTEEYLIELHTILQELWDHCDHLDWLLVVDFTEYDLLVSRKLWTGTLNKRIMQVWEQCHALHPTQYGYRHNLGTESEILQLINIIEDADKTN